MIDIEGTKRDWKIRLMHKHENIDMVDAELIANTLMNGNIDEEKFLKLYPDIKKMCQVSTFSLDWFLERIVELSTTGIPCKKIVEELIKYNNLNNS